MYIAKVIGNVVSTRKEPQLTGNKLLIVQLLRGQADIQTKHLIVAIDRVGAGSSDYVLVTCGSAATRGLVKTDAPIDAAIVGILDDFTEQSEVLINGN
ncbi:EutN/CcmL family microcompartment protein [Lacticaseibacillus sp. GG6-2]